MSEQKSFLIPDLGNIIGNYSGEYTYEKLTKVDNHTFPPAKFRAEITEGLPLNLILYMKEAYNRATKLLKTPQILIPDGYRKNTKIDPLVLTNIIFNILQEHYKLDENKLVIYDLWDDYDELNEIKQKIEFELDKAAEGMIGYDIVINETYSYIFNDIDLDKELIILLDESKPLITLGNYNLEKFEYNENKIRDLIFDSIFKIIDNEKNVYDTDYNIHLKHKELYIKYFKELCNERKIKLIDVNT